MEVTLWGVRGSIANPTPARQFYGANTTCVELRLASGGLLIFDAGTGIRSLGKELPAQGECHIFISHGHSDHVQGLSFFPPFFNPDWTINLYLPEGMEDLPHRLFDGNSFPVAFEDLKSKIIIRTVKADSEFEINVQDEPLLIKTFACNHPGGSVAYKVQAGKPVFLFSGDHEITDDPGIRQKTAGMLEGVHTAVVDAAYSREDQPKGWGHSAWEDWAILSERAGVIVLVLSHHSPDRADAELDVLQKFLNLKREKGKEKMQVVAAREGMRLFVPAPVEVECRSSDWIVEFTEKLSQFREENALLDSILQKAREITRADAGTFFLADADELVFAYSQNDTLFPGNTQNKSAYVNMRLPINTDSIAGYTGATGRSLNIPDVYRLPPNVPYSFNESFDKSTGYQTHSVLTTPLFSRDRALLGVLQIINSLSPLNGKPQPFARTMIMSVERLVADAATYLEISAQVRENVKRLMDIARMHDPSETGPHAERVGAISAELYHRWAIKKQVPLEDLRYFKSRLRLAAMLHDIGKVGISDLILKKPGKLTDEEFLLMKRHTEFGAALFAGDAKDIDVISRDISLHHHQKWNGKGYPLPVQGKALASREIPLSARIVAVADVFDALVSPRCYKKPWSFAEAERQLHMDAGEHFDPEIVDCFSEIRDVVSMIYERFPDSGEAAPLPE
ncbi:MAG: HD domain-containing protein [Desulfovibrio sp.]|jgi:HD-GYP domain-containing protein (c-di-GMP phosphodiesterase class II)/phosphoribosyl 1,2-cyclic phosphodiesterase|nr:HD domain-containing protein [Desulfovibrio sp.]